MKIRFRCVYNRKKLLNKEGKALVQIEALSNKKRAYFSTNIYIKPEQWNNCVTNHPLADDYNALLLDYIIKLERAEMDLWKAGVEPTLDHLRIAWKGNKTILDFEEFTHRVVNESMRTERTKKCLLATAAKMSSYKRVDVNKVDYSYLKGFESHLYSTGMHQNTVAKQMQNIRTILSEAIRRDLLINDPFLKYQKPRTIKGEHITLTENELLRLSKVNIHTDVRDAFLFCSQTGLRFSDYKQLSQEHFVRVRGKEWLIIKTQKTMAEVRIPMFLIGNLPHPTIGANSDVNRKLKEICRVAKIEKPIHFHVSRHTFATNLLNRGVPITTVQKLLGHSSLRMTSHYAETSDKRVEKDLKKVLLRS